MITGASLGKTAPRLIVLAGLPGTGKSTLARLLAERLRAVWLRVDTIEAALLKAGLSQSFETGLAAYVAACDLARDHLRLGQSVVVDAVNGVKPARRMWAELGRECGASRYVVELSCPDREEHRRRVEAARGVTPPLPPPSWDDVVGRPYEPWDEPTLRIDSREPLDRSAARVLAYVGAAVSTGSG